MRQAGQVDLRSCRRGRRCRRRTRSPPRGVSATQPTHASVDHVVQRGPRLGGSRPRCSPRRAAISQDRSTCSIGWPSPRSVASENAATSSASRSPESESSICRVNPGRRTHRSFIRSQLHSQQGGHHDNGQDEIRERRARTVAAQALTSTLGLTRSADFPDGSPKPSARLAGHCLRRRRRNNHRSHHDLPVAADVRLVHHADAHDDPRLQLSWRSYPRRPVLRSANAAEEPVPSAPGAIRSTNAAEQPLPGAPAAHP